MNQNEHEYEIILDEIFFSAIASYFYDQVKDKSREEVEKLFFKILEGHNVVEKIEDSHAQYNKCFFFDLAKLKLLRDLFVDVFHTTIDGSELSVAKLTITKNTQTKNEKQFPFN